MEKIFVDDQIQLSIECLIRQDPRREARPDNRNHPAILFQKVHRLTQVHGRDQLHGHSQSPFRRVQMLTLNRSLDIQHHGCRLAEMETLLLRCYPQVFHYHQVYRCHRYLRLSLRLMHLQPDRFLQDHQWLGQRLHHQNHPHLWMSSLLHLTRVTLLLVHQ